MNKTVLEQEALKLFGGAEITIEPYSDAVSSAWDMTVIPRIDKSKRFIRISTALGLPAAIAYLKKIQQNILELKRTGVIGIKPIEEEIPQEKIDKAIQEKTKALEQSEQSVEENLDLENLIDPKIVPKIFTCQKCEFTTKYPGIFGIHQKRHDKKI